MKLYGEPINQYGTFLLLPTIKPIWDSHILIEDEYIKT